MRIKMTVRVDWKLWVCVAVWNVFSVRVEGERD